MADFEPWVAALDAWPVGVPFRLHQAAAGTGEPKGEGFSWVDVRAVRVECRAPSCRLGSISGLRLPASGVLAAATSPGAVQP